MCHAMPRLNEGSGLVCVTLPHSLKLTVPQARSIISLHIFVMALFLLREATR